MILKCFELQSPDSSHGIVYVWGTFLKWSLSSGAHTYSCLACFLWFSHIPRCLRHSTSLNESKLSMSPLCVSSLRDSGYSATSVYCQEFCFSQMSKRSERLGHTHPPCWPMPPLAQEPHGAPRECSLRSCCLCPQPVFLAVSSLCLFT